MAVDRPCGCQDNPVQRQPASPARAGFLLYAERSIHLGDCCCAEGGDIGVHAVAERGYGTQLTVGAHSILDPCHTIYAPTVRLGFDVNLGPICANSVEDDRVPLRSPLPFPAAGMPPPMLSPAPGPGGIDQIVYDRQVAAILPGDYGALAAGGTVLFNPGVYTFDSVSLADGARLVALSGDVQIRVKTFLAAGRGVRAFPAFHAPASHLAIYVSGVDETPSRPAVSFGEHCRIRALLAAPHGTVAIADHSRATGAVAAFDIAVGRAVHLEFQCGFPAEAAKQNGSQQLQGYYGPHPDPEVAPLVGPVPPDTLVPLAIGLPVRDRAGLQAFIKQVSDPKSPNFRKYLTQSQFTATYGAVAADYQALRDWATANGLTIYATFANNLLLCVYGTAAQIEQALFVNLTYRLQNDGVGRFVAVDREPSLNLSVPLLRISGLTGFRVPQPLAVNGTGGCPGAGCGGSWRAADIRNAYLGSDANIMRLDGTGQVVGLLELNSYSQSDIVLYDSVQIPPLNPGNVQLHSVASPPIFSGYSPSAETVLDIEMVQAMAPGAAVLVFQTALGATLHGDDVLHSMATSSPALGSASCSYNFGRSDNSEQALEQMAAQGTSFFTASGDYGDVGDPQSNLDMPTQTLVGGTVLSTNPLSSPFPSPVYPNPYYAGENTWNQASNRQKGVTGGGVMDGNNQNGNCYCWPHPTCCGSGVGIPDWQIGLMQIAAGANGGSTQWRNYPDVALLASNIEIYYQARAQVVGGTSAAAPLWAGYVALINQRIKQIDANASLAGFLNPTLCDIGLTRGSANDLYSVCFNDIADGVSNNDGFGAGFKSVPGYDLCTGLGTPKVGFIYQLSSPTPLTPNQPLALIRFVIQTGKDDAGGGLHGSEQTADVFLQDGTSFNVILRQSNEPNWDSWSTHTVDAQIPPSVFPPLTPSHGIKGVRLNQVQNNPDWSADNWDVVSLAVSLFNPPFTAATSVCQLNLVGNNQLQDGTTGLVRLSKSAGPSGDGPSSPVYNTGPGSGCP